MCFSCVLFLPRSGEVTGPPCLGMMRAYVRAQPRNWGQVWRGGAGVRMTSCTVYCDAQSVVQRGRTSRLRSGGFQIRRSLGLSRCTLPVNREMLYCMLDWISRTDREWSCVSKAVGHTDGGGTGGSEERESGKRLGN